MTQPDLIARLRGYLERKKMSHQRLSRQLGVSPGTLGQWLQGHRKLRPDECKRIEDILKK